MFNLRSLLQEVGRRHVARVAVLYAAVAFAVLEVADIVIPPLGLPEWSIRFVIGLALLGFPVTLILAWVYDLTPQGVVRTRSLEEDGQAGLSRPEAGHPMAAAFLLLTSGAILAGGALLTFQWSHSDPASDSAIPGASGGVLNPLRIAVLPLVALDETDEGVFFANGIHEDILNHLAKIGSLEVISRTTVLQYRDSGKSANEIGIELNAGSILEGTVRKQDNRVLVVAQLIDTRTEAHLWSKDFDREEEDIFDLQSEIAQEIAQALQAELTPDELQQLETATPVSGEAYDRYSQGIFEWDLRENRGNAIRAVELFQAATEVDSVFATAYAALSQARMWLFWKFPGFQDQAELAREALDRALVLAPDAVETRLALGYFYFYGRGDSQEALRYFTEAENLKPSDANVISARGFILRGQGRWEEAVAAFERARTYDPRSYNLNYTLAETYFRMRRYSDAERSYQLAATLAPEVQSAHRGLFLVRLATSGDTLAGREYLQSLPRTLSPMVRMALEADLAYYRRDYENALGGGPRPGRPGGADMSRNVNPAVAPAADPAADSAGDPPVGPPGDLASARDQGAFPGRGGRDHERLALLYHLMGNEELSHLHADSLRVNSEATLEAARANPGPVQTGVIARAHAKMGIAYALLGEGINASVEGSSAVIHLPIFTDAYEGAEHVRDLAITYILIGELELALEQIEAALAVPSPLTRVELELDPIFDPMRELPRFQELLAALRPTPSNNSP